MPQPRVAPYGSWRSPVTTDLIVAGTVGLSQIARDGDDLYWVESRPSEGGRNVIVRRAPDGATADVTPAPFNVRTRVHEYGGGAYTVADGVVFFANFGDQRLYRQDPGAAPRPITPEAALRFADFALDPGRDRLIGVREDHTAADREAVNAIVAVAAEGDPDGGRVLVTGNDFYAAPRLSPDGSRLAWLTWNHPNMPWDDTELWVGEIGEDGGIAHAERIAGGPRESVLQPVWAPDGSLCFISDRTDWWNLYRAKGGEIEPLCEMDAEFAEAAWVFGLSNYGFANPDRIVCAYLQNGIAHLASLDLATRTLADLPSPYTDIWDLCVAPDRVVFIAGSPTDSASIISYDLATQEPTVLRRSSDVKLEPGYVSVPQPIEFPTEGGLTAHGFYYPPKNPDFTAPAGELPPLLVQSHGGPTGANAPVLSLALQYWTSRGFAVLDVNYGGSTGYGRPYRERLNDNWGIVDVDDCVNGARYLVAQGLVDPDRLIIRGWSASGYTTLAALTFRDVFKAGASHYGISDLEAMAQETHKFESRYLDGLIGPYPARRDVYLERSPIHFTDRLSAPLILFQGLEDKIVPPNQAEMMYEAVRGKGLPVAHIAFEGEQHGFRRSENIKRAIDGELDFYARVFGFEPAEPILPVPIANM